MLSCKQLVKIVSSEDKPTWRHRLEIRFHLLMCHHCRKYVKHLEFIKNGFKELFKNESQKVESAKIKELENKVLDKIKKESSPK